MFLLDNREQHELAWLEWEQLSWISHIVPSEWQESCCLKEQFEN